MTSHLRVAWRQRIAAADLHLDYQPDLGAPVEGEWVRGPAPAGAERLFPEGIATGWRQDHRALVEDALYSWKGSPLDMDIHMGRVRRGEPTLGSGSGKKMDMQAAALVYEIEHHGQPNPMRLYRGSHEQPMGFEAWSEDRNIARRFQRKGQGQVFSLPPGAGHGIRIADYIRSSLDVEEREWIIDTDRSRIR